jgi:hypothetical protein
MSIMSENSIELCNYSIGFTNDDTQFRQARKNFIVLMDGISW